MYLGYDIEAKSSVAKGKYIYQTEYNEGTQIVFNHEQHADGFGLECIECHHVESCNHCHRKDVGLVEVVESKVALHKSCLKCHEGMDVGHQERDECHQHCPGRRSLYKSM